jgi:WD40 repeat protein
VAELIDDLDKPTRRNIRAAVNINFVGVVNLSLTGSPTSQSPRTRSLRIQLDMAEEVIRQDHVGDLTSEHGWIEARAEMAWAALPGTKTMLFCGYVGDLLVVLSGSESNLWGSPSAATQEGSQLYAVKAALRDSGRPGDLGSALQAAAARQIGEMPPQPVRFLAWVLANGPLADDAQRTKYVLATPLYVEAADPAEIDPKDASRQEPRPTAKELLDRRENGNAAVRAASSDHKAVEPDQAGKPTLQATELPKGTRRRRRMLVSAVAACLVAAGVAGVLLYRSPPSTPAPGQSQMTGHDLMPDHNGVPVKPQPSLTLPAIPEARLADPDSSGVDSVAFSPDDSIVATADYDGSAYLWRAAGPRRYTIIGKGVQDHGSGLIWGAALSRDGATFATVDNVGDVVIRSVTGLQNQLFTLSGPRSTSAFAIAYDPNNPFLVAAGYSNGNTYLWSIAGQFKHLIAGLPGPKSKAVRSVAFNPQGTVLAAGDVNGHTYIFNVQTHRRIADLYTPGSAQVYGVAFSPDGTVLAAADNDGDTYLWDVANGTLMATLHRPGETELRGVAYSPFGTVIAVAEAAPGSPILLWNVVTDKIITGLYDPNSDGAQSVAFSLDGNTLAVADSNGSAYLWNVSALNNS